MKKRLLRKLIAIMLAVATMVSLSTNAWARTKITYYVELYDWTYYKTTKTTNVYQGSYNTYYTYKKYYLGASKRQDWIHLTDEYKHVQGSQDVSIEKTKAKSFTISGSGSADVKSFLKLSAGLSFSYSNSTKITHKLAESLESGYYAYAMRARTREGMMEKYTDWFNPVKNKYYSGYKNRTYSYAIGISAKQLGWVMFDEKDW